VLKYLLLAIAVIAFIAIIRGSGARRKSRAPAAPSQIMAKCAHCGVHFPADEGISEMDKMYCCEDHHKRGVIS
jgi:uncharacterized protein